MKNLNLAAFKKEIRLGHRLTVEEHYGDYNFYILTIRDFNTSSLIATLKTERKETRRFKTLDSAVSVAREIVSDAQGESGPAISEVVLSIVIKDVWSS